MSVLADRDIRAELESGKAFHLPLDGLHAAGLADRVLGEALALRGLGADPEAKGRAFELPFQSVPRFDNRIPFFVEYLRKKQEERERCFIYLGAEGVRRELAVLLETHGVAHIESDTAEVATPRSEAVLCVGALARGFAFPSERIAFFSEKEILSVTADPDQGYADVDRTNNTIRKPVTPRPIS